MRGYAVHSWRPFSGTMNRAAAPLSAREGCRGLPLEHNDFPMSKLRRLAIALLVLALVGVAAGRWYQVSQPAYRVQRADEAILRGDWDEVERLVWLLKSAGQWDQAYLLSGKALYRNARVLLDAGQSGKGLPLLEQA